VKKCHACKLELPADSFSPDKRNKDGLQSSCRRCQSAVRRALYHANPEAARKRHRDYYVRRKEVVRAVNNRSRMKNLDRIKARKREAYLVVRDDADFKKRLKSYNEKHKDRKSDYDRKYRGKNSARLAELKSKWRAEHADLLRVVRATYKARRRAWHVGGATSAEVAQWLRSQVLTCRYCASDCAGNFHIDHVVPLSRGGKHETQNLAIACASCNVRKNSKDAATFQAMLESA
jgi:5-methylcytosine-specific restriction endonuclease McrA